MLSPNYPKAEQVILYICQKMEEAPHFGTVVLNKLLFYMDNVHFLEYGKPLTGFTYVKQNRGPTPKPHQFLSLREAMIQQGKLREHQVHKFGKIEKRLVAQTEPNITVFTGPEISTMDEIISEMKNESGKTLSEFSHRHLAWEIADLMEEIPYFTYLLTESELTDEDVQWGKEQIAKYAKAS